MSWWRFKLYAWDTLRLLTRPGSKSHTSESLIYGRDETSISCACERMCLVHHQTRRDIKCICVHHNWMMNVLNAHHVGRREYVAVRIVRSGEKKRIVKEFDSILTEWKRRTMQFFNYEMVDAGLVVRVRKWWTAFEIRARHKPVKSDVFSVSLLMSFSNAWPRIA